MLIKNTLSKKFEKKLKIKLLMYHIAKLLAMIWSGTGTVEFWRCHMINKTNHNGLLKN